MLKQSLTPVRIWLYQLPADMRKSYDGLAGLVQTVLKHDPHSGHWFVFRNRRGNRMKILVWEGDGFALWQKRLERGTFRFPSHKGEITRAELAFILDGIEWEEIKKLPRYSRHSVNVTLS
jgi:transposase